MNPQPMAGSQGLSLGTLDGPHGAPAPPPPLSKHHYPVKPSFFVPLAVLGQGGGRGNTEAMFRTESIG